MNAPLRRVGVVVLVLFGLLFLNLNWVQAYKATAYRTNPHNARVQLSEYQRQRGVIAVSGGQVIVAQSVATSDELKYLRKYPVGPEFAPITGYKPVNLGATGIEAAENDFLSGNADSLFADRLKEMFTGSKTTGGNVLLTVDKSVQDTAYNDLLNNRLDVKNGAAVAIDPRTGAILAMASTPSYDPNPLASHDTDDAASAFSKLDNNSAQPLLNRATQETFPPGSTMKVIDSAAALSTGQYTPQTQIPAGPTYTPVAGGGFTIRNEDSGICPAANVTLLEALTVSCNTGFAQLGVKLGAQQLKSTAQAFGFEDGGLTIAGGDTDAMGVAASHTGPMTNQDGSDDPNAVAQSAIGQLDVRMTPMQGALIAATVADSGTQMRPYLIDKLQAPDLSTTYTAKPSTLRHPVTSQVAGSLQQMMESVVDHGTGTKAQISGFQVGGKTGTAQNEGDQLAHGWFIGFVMKDNQPIAAVAVFLQNAGDAGSGEAARIAGDMMKSVIAAKGIK
jgi:peptidoglycan glycosyltransferase